MTAIREIRPTEAFYAMIDPWRDHGSLTLVGFEPTGIAVPEVPIDPVISDHTRYFGWSDDRVIETVDFGAAASSMSNTGILRRGLQTAICGLVFQRVQGIHRRCTLTMAPSISFPCL